MNTIDALVLVVVAFNLLLGAIRGAAWQVLRVASIVLGIWAAVVYGEEFLAMFPASMGLSDTYGLVVARVVIFLSVYLVMFGVTHLVKSLINKIKLGSMDRTLGAALGAAKGFAFCCIALYLQFTPLREIDLVENHLDGNEAEGIPPSVVNGIFTRYVKQRIDEVVPDDVSRKVEDLGSRVGRDLGGSQRGR